MRITNLEIKAVCHDPGKIRKILSRLHADFRGRLKLRESNIENHLLGQCRELMKDLGIRDVELVFYGDR